MKDYVGVLREMADFLDQRQLDDGVALCTCFNGCGQITLTWDTFRRVFPGCTLAIQYGGTQRYVEVIAGRITVSAFLDDPPLNRPTEYVHT